jgi:dethiobiotin synthetase
MKLFITGIGTDVGKTIASAIITEALEADYWKPIQAGDLETSDSHKVGQLLSNTKTTIFANSYAFKTAASPHLAAANEGVTISFEHIKEPETQNHLVIEGAGGLLVPLNDNDTIMDLIRPLSGQHQPHTFNNRDTEAKRNISCGYTVQRRGNAFYRRDHPQ